MAMFAFLFRHYFAVIGITTFDRSLSDCYRKQSDNQQSQRNDSEGIQTVFHVKSPKEQWIRAQSPSLINQPQV
jgi:hypothetical protein